MKRRALRFIIALLLLLPLSVVFTQDEPSIALDIIGIDSTELTDVAVLATVLDASGQLVSGLDVANFSIGGDLRGLAEIRRVNNVTDDALNFASVLVIDTSSSMADVPLAEAREAAQIYIDALEPGDPVAIVTFGSDVKRVLGYTTDRAVLQQVLDTLRYGGKTALYDATFRGIELATESPLPSKVIVILSDGGEFGDVSEHSRDESIRAATINGVPVYSVGLGWDIDRRFLEAISGESNAAFYDSPTPEELSEIYRNLAFLFRSQYIVTISVDVPADGKRYDFSLDVATGDGRTSSGRATLRAPIPTPLLFLPEDLFDEAISEDTVIKVEIQADQDIASIEYALDGEVVSTEESFTIEPEKQEPGDHQLDITVSDVEGDTGTLSTEIEIAALPPTVSDDFETATQEEIADAEVISVDAGGQTEITQVEFIVDGEVVKTDNEAPYDFDLDPFTLRPQEHQLTIRATNAGGQTTTIERTFEIEKLPPRLEIQGLTEDTVVTDTVSGSATALGQSPIVSLSLDPDVGTAVAGNQLQFTLDAADLPPGRNTIAIRAVDEAGVETIETVEFQVAALPPTVAISGVAIEAVIEGPREVEVETGGQTEITEIEVSYDGGPPEVVEEQRFTIPAEELGDGEHEAEVRVTNAGGETTTVTLPFTVDLPPTPTITPVPTGTATSTSTASATSTATDTDMPPPSPIVTDTPPFTATPSDEEATATGAVIETMTATVLPTDSPVPPTDIDTAVPPTDTDTPLPPTHTNTAVPPTDTDTAVPPTDYEYGCAADEYEYSCAANGYGYAAAANGYRYGCAANGYGYTAAANGYGYAAAAGGYRYGRCRPRIPIRRCRRRIRIHRCRRRIRIRRCRRRIRIRRCRRRIRIRRCRQRILIRRCRQRIRIRRRCQPIPIRRCRRLILTRRRRQPIPIRLPPPTDTDTPVPPTDTDTPVPTETDTPVPTATDTPVPTDTDTPVPTDTDTPVPTDTDTPVPTDTDTPVPTDTDTPVPTDTDTPVPTDTDTPVPTDTDTPVPTDTDTPVPTDTDTPVPTDTDTPVPTDTDTPVPTDTDTPVPTDTDTPVPTDTDTPVPTDTDTPVPTDTDTPVPTDTDTPVPTDTDTPVPTDTDTPVPTDTDTPVPTDTDTPVPTDTDTPVPTDTDTPVPTDTDTPVPTDTETPVPTDTDTPVPTDTDTPVPTDTDTPVPTDTDTPVPTDTDTPVPTANGYRYTGANGYRYAGRQRILRRRFRVIHQLRQQLQRPAAITNCDPGYHRNDRSRIELDRGRPEHFGCGRD